MKITLKERYKSESNSPANKSAEEINSLVINLLEPAQQTRFSPAFMNYFLGFLLVLRAIINSLNRSAKKTIR